MDRRAADLADVRALLVAPDEAVGSGHLIDDRMTLPESVRPCMPCLRLATAHMATGRAQSQVEPAAAFLARRGLGLGDCLRNMGTGGWACTEPVKEVHAPTVSLGSAAGCVVGHEGEVP
jgi:hypothetical protein